MKKCPQCGVEYPDTTTLCPADGVALEKSSDSLVGKTLADKYRIEEVLSEGGMGTVYRGRHVLMDKIVAIKVLRPGLAADEKVVARFSREARAASRISHPHALVVTDFGEAEGGIVFLVMEYLEGETLKEVIRREGQLPLSRIVKILSQVGGALDAAHSQGVVHRDLKSENIMLVTTNGSDYAKVLDFGIAKIIEPSKFDPGLTSPDLVIGTPQYMSPEQCSQAGEIDARSDIYSLGIILYEMLVGHVPFTGDSPTTIMLKHLQEPVPSVLEERRDISTSVAHVVSRALAKRPEDRYQTVSELTEDLSIAIGNPQRGISTPVTKETAPPRLAEASDRDEETVVRSRREITIPIQDRTTSSQSIPAAGFNPWKIMVPSVVGLLVIFAVVYVLTRHSPAPTVAEPAPALNVDPNSRPVEPGQPPTGKAEENIPATTSANQNSEAGSTASPSPRTGEVAPDVDEGLEPEDEEEEANTNTNRAPALPSPTREIKIEQPPIPTPAIKPPASPTPTPL